MNTEFTTRKSVRKLRCNPKIKIGKAYIIHKTVVLDPKNGYIHLGNSVSLNQYCVLLGREGIEIGEGVRIASSVVISGVNHKMKRNKKIIDQGITADKIVIEDDCWIGMGSRIIAGAYLHKGCVIGAGSVVNKEVPEYEIWAGVPAQKIGERE